MAINQTIGAGWSSPVARQAHNLKVIGSNPIPATKLSPVSQALGPYLPGFFMATARSLLRRLSIAKGTVFFRPARSRVFQALRLAGGKQQYWASCRSPASVIAFIVAQLVGKVAAVVI